MVHSSRRRPPGPTEGVTTTRSLLTWTLFALFTSAHGKVDHLQPPHYRSAFTGGSSSPPPAISSHSHSHPGRSPAEIPLLDRDTPTAKFRNTDNENIQIQRYQDALAPAHDISAVRAPPAQPHESSSGLSALPPARLLQDWDAEDIVLLSTIDGALHARDRKTGQHRWTLETPDTPMIETINYPQNRSEFDGMPPEDEYMFIVEPSKDGQLYAQFMNPQIGLVRLPATVKKMATEVPFTMRVNGHQLTTVAEQSYKAYTIDMATGEILYEVSPGRRVLNKHDSQPRCRRRNDLELEDPACRPGRTIRLGRNTYSFTISDEQFGHDLCVITFSEWATNKADSDLQSQYAQSLDGNDIQVQFNGRIIGIDSTANPDRMNRYTHVLDAPVAQVFDVIRSLEDEDDSNLAVLSRPMDLPLREEAQVWRLEMKNSQRVYVNQTEQGQWYALSELSYPGVSVGAQQAGITQHREGQLLDLEGDLRDIVGVHILSQSQVTPPVRLTISQTSANNDEIEDQSHQLAPLETAEPPARIAPASAKEGWLSTLVAMLLTGILVAYSGRVWGSVQPRIARVVGRLPQQKVALPAQIVEVQTSNEVPADDIVVPSSSPTETPVVHDRESVTPTHSREHSTASASPKPSPRKKSRASDDDSGSDDDSDNDEGPPEDANTGLDGAKPKKKYTKRGKRGGRKNKKKAMDPTTFAPKSQLATEQQLEGGFIQVGRLKVDTREENCLGHGSNGTTVYPGSYEGFQVAVKRLVKSTNDLAEKEIQHLMSSMENNHIIRYVCKEESLNFFYIALDRYTTSLDQFIEHPEKFPTLVSPSGGFDVKDCLRQITLGLKHLHSLKLVHRDIKPQNVLVKAIHSERPGPRKLHFVISDFGLCKPLEEGAMSTFAPTANHTAAGTTGWRAPELLVSNRDGIAAPSALAASTHSSASRSSTMHSSTPDGTVVTSGRRATKAIDIFSLGCVFYYVMTQGCHPYDKGGSSLGRDLNIKEDNVTTEALRLHQYEYDADDLVLQMLKHEPKERPDCDSVLLHPYFGDQHTKLNFVCAVSNSYENVKNSITNIHDETAPRTPAEQDALLELAALESKAAFVIGTRSDGSIRDFLSAVPKAFINEMGKQRKYTGTKMIDLLRVIRNKFQHFDDISPDVRDGLLGGSPQGYYRFWSSKFPSLLINCHCLMLERGLVERFKLGRFYGREVE